MAWNRCGKFTALVTVGQRSQQNQSTRNLLWAASLGPMCLLILFVACFLRLISLSRILVLTATNYIIWNGNPGSPNAMEKKIKKNRSSFKDHVFLSREFQSSKIGDYHFKWLVGGWTNPSETNMIVQLEISSPSLGVNIKKCLSCHHLVMISWLDFQGEGRFIPSTRSVSLTTRWWQSQPSSLALNPRRQGNDMVPSLTATFP